MHQEPFKSCLLCLSLWAFCFLKLDFCHFSLIHSFPAAFLLRLSGDKAQKSRSPKESNDCGCFGFVLEFDSKCLKEAWGNEILCCKCISHPMNSWLIIRVRVVQFQHEYPMCESWRSLLLQLLEARDKGLKGQESNLLHVSLTITCYLLLAIMYTLEREVIIWEL